MTEGLAGIKSGGWFSEAASVVGNQVLIFAPSVTVPAFGDHSQGSLEPPPLTGLWALVSLSVEWGWYST